MITKLHDQFKPNAYTLNLDIDSEHALFSGTVTISGKLATSASEVVLHAKDLTIKSATINAAKATVNTGKFDTLHLVSESTISAEAVEIVIEFNGAITDAMHGMYPCYFEHNGVRKKLIATQFESHHAREVFPCIDEPAAKATFDLTLTTPSGETVLANTPIQNQHEESGRVITQFETTPIMSTYLLAFVCGEMISKEATTKDGVIVRSWASVAQNPSWLDYSVQETVDLIEFYNDFFGIPYPLEKCDQVALPDFESGAMENWGLITYRETVLLSDPENISLSTQQWVSLVVAHELSHQWFGNLVTMNWWDDLWLNESFANMTEYLAVDALHPEWNIWEEFVAHDALSATNRDVYSDVQAVRVEVNDPAEISTLFDPSIVYAKGGKLLKMLYDLLGKEAWRAGLKDYFTTNAYKNTSRDDLWNALSNHTELDIAKLMNTWIEHAGQPLLTVAQYGENVSISQERLLLDGKKSETTWEVPLLNDSLPRTFDSAKAEFQQKDSNWVMLNSTGVGHYITNYTEPAHKKWLAEQITNPEVASTWKISRLNELVMLAKHGDTNLSEALETIKSTQNEERAMVWSLISSVIGNARMLTEGNETAEAAIKTLAKNLASNNFEKLGWDYAENEDSNATHLRTFTLGLMASSEDQSVIDYALDLYRQTENSETLPAEIRSLVLAVVAKFGTNEEFNQLIEKYKTAETADYKVDICSGLTATKDTERIKTLLELMLDTTTVRSQDLRHWFVNLLRNRHGRPLAWQWLTTNWGWIIENFGGSKSYDDFARYSAGFFSTEKMLQE
jgi:aminopeptidase N